MEYDQETNAQHLISNTFLCKPTLNYVQCNPIGDWKLLAMSRFVFSLYKLDWFFRFGNGMFGFFGFHAASHLFKSISSLDFIFQMIQCGFCQTNLLMPARFSSTFTIFWNSTKLKTHFDFHLINVYSQIKALGNFNNVFFEGFLFVLAIFTRLPTWFCNYTAGFEKKIGVSKFCPKKKGWWGGISTRVCSYSLESEMPRTKLFIVF